MAACILVFCGNGTWYLEDGAAATENILVAAQACGLGSCWVDGDKKPYAETVRQEAGTPEGYKLVSMVALGYPAEPHGSSRSGRSPKCCTGNTSDRSRRSGSRLCRAAIT